MKETKKEVKKDSPKVAKKAVKKVAKKESEEKDIREEEKVAKKSTGKKVAKEETKKEANKASKKQEKPEPKKAEKKKTSKPVQEEPAAETAADAGTKSKTGKGKAAGTQKAPKKKSSKKGAGRLESILDLNANNVWDLDEDTIAEAWERERETEDFSISEQKLLGIIRLAFEVVHYNPDDEREASKYENTGWAKIMHCKKERGCVALRRKAIERITDLSYENIRHITTAMLLELIDRNFGGGWDSIALAIRDIIETGFDISTTQLPASRIHAPGGTVEKKVAQGFDVLEIPKGTWVEAIFAKKKDPVEKLRMEPISRSFDEDGNPIDSSSQSVSGAGGDDDEDLGNDDTYFSSLTPEADVKDLEEEGLNIEDAGTVEDE